MTIKDAYQMAWEELLITEKAYIGILQDVYNVVTMNRNIEDNRYISVTRVPHTLLREKLLGNWFELLSFHKK
ncbi:unnamed protein product [Heterobilharzia americana]|nr:unnamed protein product [Heterobilharzia americana]